MWSVQVWLFHITVESNVYRLMAPFYIVLSNFRRNTSFRVELQSNLCTAYSVTITGKDILLKHKELSLLFLKSN